LGLLARGVTVAMFGVSLTERRRGMAPEALFTQFRQGYDGTPLT
jgi:hypothetical protein